MWTRKRRQNLMLKEEEFFVVTDKPCALTKQINE